MLLFSTFLVETAHTYGTGLYEATIFKCFILLKDYIFALMMHAVNSSVIFQTTRRNIYVWAANIYIYKQTVVN